MAYSQDVKEPFDPPGAHWRRVSASLRTVRLISLGTVTAAIAVLGLALGAVTTWWAGGLAAAAAVVAFGWGASIIDRQVRSWGYDVGPDTLSIRHGVMFRELVVVPYARIQYVDVQAGPLVRKFGLASVQLHTASAATDAAIPGLPAPEAANLRDQLARLGETRSVGL